MNDPVPELLHFRVSHHSEKARWALDFKRWPHRRRAMLPGFHLLPVRLVSGQNQLPVLKLDGRVIAGSDRILAELERLRPDPPLLGCASARWRSRPSSTSRWRRTCGGCSGTATRATPTCARAWPPTVSPASPAPPGAWRCRRCGR
jgi:glutathione S-transferase